MGYGSYKIAGGKLAGQWAGYNVERQCCHKGCKVLVARGVDAMCGRDPHGGDETSCGAFFCPDHLIHVHVDGHSERRCPACARECPFCHGEGDTFRQTADVGLVRETRCEPCNGWGNLPFCSTCEGGEPDRDCVECHGRGVRWDWIGALTKELTADG